MVYIPGDYKVICDRCGFVKLRSQCKIDGNNKQLLVCSDCFDPKHPQDRPIYGKGEKQKVPIPRPEQEDTFIDVNFNA